MVWACWVDESGHECEKNGVAHADERGEAETDQGQGSSEGEKVGVCPDRTSDQRG